MAGCVKKGTYSVFPRFSWLIDEWLEHIIHVPGEFIIPNWLAMIPKLFVEKGVPKAGCVTMLVSRRLC